MSFTLTINTSIVYESMTSMKNDINNKLCIFFFEVKTSEVVMVFFIQTFE